MKKIMLVFIIVLQCGVVFATDTKVTADNYSWDTKLLYLQSSNDDYQFYLVEKKAEIARTTVYPNTLPELMLSQAEKAWRGLTLKKDLNDAGYEIKNLHSGLMMEYTTNFNTGSFYYKYTINVYDAHWYLLNSTVCGCYITNKNGKDIISFEIPFLDSINKGIWYIEFVNPDLISRDEYLNIMGAY